MVGTLPDGKSVLMLVTARLKCVANGEWAPAATWTSLCSKSSRTGDQLNLRNSILVPILFQSAIRTG